jgi:hypothetical protein
MTESSLQLLHKLTRTVWPDATLVVNATEVRITTKSEIVFLITARSGGSPLLIAIGALQHMIGAV